MLQGFEIPLYQELQEQIPVSLIASGGAGSYDHIVALFRETACDGVAIGKMLALRDYDIVRIKSYLRGRKVPVRDA
jgi:cyclase